MALVTRAALVTCAALAGLGVALAGCATQREQRISSAEAREHPSEETCEPKGKPPTPSSVWACGYWHWDSVRYVWVDGRWQAP